MVFNVHDGSIFCCSGAVRIIQNSVYHLTVDGVLVNAGGRDAIPAHSGAFGHPFHKHPATYSGIIRPPIPVTFGHPHRSAATHRFAA